ncbi:hypothetical protein DMC47_43740 [Nostoc sp. 3335mG]|nr:hypothetical protein DMC47_43740 [Nostoc sp. 3335mG]
MDDGPARMSISAGRATPVSVQEPSEALLVAVLVCRPPERLDDFTDAMLALAGELAQLEATILLMNDIPGDAAVAVALEIAQERMRGKIPAYIVENPEHLGFVASANRAMETALATDRDLVLLTPDMPPRAGAIAEMQAVAYCDPLIAVAAPRSDTGVIAGSPFAQDLRGSGGDAAYQAHRAIEPLLPRYHYVPEVGGGALLVRRLTMAEFGVFDPVYDGVAAAADDFIRRCNQRGYRAVLANRAYVHRLDEGLSSDDKGEHDRAILSARYPERARSMERYLANAERHAEHVLSGILPRGGKLRLLFDCRVMAPHYNGTLEHMNCLLRAFASGLSDRYAISVLCDEEAFRFHGLHEVDGLRLCGEEEALQAPSAVAFRLSQPDADSLFSLCRFGAVTGALILDTIGMDCQQLDTSDLHRIWLDAAWRFDVLGFNSQFTQAQFNRRFAVPDQAVQAVSLCSTDPADYAAGEAAARPGSGLLLVGNHYPHKHVREMVAALAAAGSTVPITAFGIEIDEPGVVASHAAGALSEELVERLYAEAGAVLYPSHYEGFGLPIMHALAHRLPVIARDLPSAREIKARCPAGRNLHLCASTEEMAALASSPPAWQDGPAASDFPIWNWDAAALALADAFEEGIRRFDFATCCRHQAAALTLEETSRTRTLQSTIAYLEEGLDLAQRAIRRFDTEIHDLNDRLASAADRERRARSAQEDAEAAEQGERAIAQQATRRAEAAEDRELQALEAKGAAEAAIERSRSLADQAHRRADDAEEREAAKAGVLKAWTASRGVSAAPEQAPGLVPAILDRLASLRWPRASIDDTPSTIGSLAGSRLAYTPGTEADEARRARFLRWAHGMALGGDVWIEATDADLASLDALLSLAGFAVKWHAQRRGRRITRAIRIRDGLGFDAGTPQFADLVYLQCFGREPDPAEREAIGHRLSIGESRIAIAIGMAASQPCWDRWRHRQSAVLEAS